MDRSISASVKGDIFGTTWKSEINNLIEFKKKFNKVKNIELYLPFITYQHYLGKYEFMYLDTKEKQHNLFRFAVYNMFYMTLFLREGFNKQTFGLELTANVEVEPQLVTRKQEYYYIWDKQQLTIRRILGTIDPDKIEKMAQDLLNEFKRFYFMYCKTN